jgi:hypothetical protein
MGTTLTGTTPQDTYDSLIKVTDNGPISATVKFLSDGLGNDSVLALSTTAVGVGTNAPAAKLQTDSSSVSEVVGLALSNSNPTFTADESVSIKFGVGTVNALAHGKILVGNTDNTFGSNGYMSFFTRGSDSVTEKMRITAAGNVGIGTSSPANKLTVVGTGSFDGAMVVRSTGTNTPQAVIGVDAVASAVGYVGTVNNIPFQIRTNDVTRLRVDADGLKFGSDTAAANALDDYEEGTWTPTSNSAGYTISAASGIYTKIGRQVVIRGSVTFSAIDALSTSVFLYLGLPFTPSGSFQGSCRENTSTGAMFAAQVRSTPDGILSSMDGVVTASQQPFAISNEYLFTLTYFV